jgi:hypothetical protein
MPDTNSKLGRLQKTRLVLDAEERRATYRVGAGSADGLQAVLIRGGVRIRAHVLDVSSEGAGLLVHQDHVAELQALAGSSAPGGWIVGLMAPTLARPLSVPALARYVGPVPGGVRIGVVFSLEDDRRSGLGDQLRALFNERRAVRARPDSSESIAVELTAGDVPPVVGILRDLSLAGMGVLVATEDASGLADVVAVSVKLRLPGTQKSQKLAATVRYRESLGLPDAAAEFGAPATHVGLAFEPDAIEESGLTAEVGAFVVRHQLRVDATAKSAAARAENAGA